MDIPEHLIVLVYNLYCGQETTVRTDSGETEWFPIGQGDRQGCILSLYYLICMQNIIIWKIGLDSEEGMKIGGRNINELRYADDTIL